MVNVRAESACLIVNKHIQANRFSRGKLFCNASSMCEAISTSHRHLDTFLKFFNRLHPLDVHFLSSISSYSLLILKINTKQANACVCLFMSKSTHFCVAFLCKCKKSLTVCDSESNSCLNALM